MASPKPSRQSGMWMLAALGLVMLVIIAPSMRDICGWLVSQLPG